MKKIALLILSVSLLTGHSLFAQTSEQKANPTINSDNVRANVPEYYEHENPLRKDPYLDSDFKMHLRSKNRLNHAEYLKKRKRMRRAHIRYLVNRRPFINGDDFRAGAKVSSLAVESRQGDSHADNVDRFTRECILHIRDTLGPEWEVLEVGYLTKRSEDRRDPASFNVDMVTGLCYAQSTAYEEGPHQSSHIVTTTESEVRREEEEDRRRAQRK